MSAPHVAGAAALVLAGGVTDANGKYGPADEVRQRLDETAFDLGPAGRDKLYGYGVVDAQGAVSGG